MAGGERKNSHDIPKIVPFAPPILRKADYALEILSTIVKTADRNRRIIAFPSPDNDRPPAA